MVCRREARPCAKFVKGSEAALLASLCCPVRRGQTPWVCRREARRPCAKFVKGSEAAPVASQYRLMCGGQTQ